MRPSAITSSIQPTRAPRTEEVGIADLNEPSNANLTDISIKEQVAWLFLEGLGVARGDVEFALKSPLALLEAPLTIERPPHPFHKTINHRLLGTTVGSIDYPFAVSYDGKMEHVETCQGNILLWSPVYLFSDTEKSIHEATHRFLENGRRRFLTDWQRISYPSYSQPLRHIVSFPGVYSPINPYVKPLIRIALQQIHGAKNRNDDIRVLVLGCGAGIEAIEITRLTGCNVDCTDINPLAVANTKASAILTDLEDRIRVWQSDGLKQVTDKYDFIVFAAPIPSSNNVSDSNRFDPNGIILTEVFQMLPNNLREAGRLLIFNRKSIDDYVPNTLVSERVLPFLVNGHSYAIHQVMVK